MDYCFALPAPYETSRVCEASHHHLQPRRGTGVLAKNGRQNPRGVDAFTTNEPTTSIVVAPQSRFPSSCLLAKIEFPFPSPLRGAWAGCPLATPPTPSRTPRSLPLLAGCYPSRQKGEAREGRHVSLRRQKIAIVHGLAVARAAEVGQQWLTVKGGGGC